MTKQKVNRDAQFIKPFHELTEAEYKKLCKRKPHMTFVELAAAYPQPTRRP